jgi:ubiquinone/menaquinone biosynthesis C-methylase UbiE
MSEARNSLQTHDKDASRREARRQLQAQDSPNTPGFPAWVFAHLHLPLTRQGLAVGCGSGALGRANHHRSPAGRNVTFADRSAGMLATAPHQLRPDDHSGRCVVHDAEALPVAEGSFAAVIAHHRLYHGPHRSAAYAEFCRVLMPSGKLDAVTPSQAPRRE